MYGGGEVACFEPKTHLGGGFSQHERFKLNQSRLKLHLVTLGEVVVNVLCNYYKRGGSQFSPKQVLQLDFENKSKVCGGRGVLVYSIVGAV